MSQYLTPRQFVRTATVGVVLLIAALAIFHSRRGEDGDIVAPTEALATELVRCRTVTLDQTASLESCRRGWAENRRQFVKPTKASPAPAEPIPTAATSSGKIQDRVPSVEPEHKQGKAR